MQWSRTRDRSPYSIQLSSSVSSSTYDYASLITLLDEKLTKNHHTLSFDVHGKTGTLVSCLIPLFRRKPFLCSAVRLRYHRRAARACMRARRSKALLIVDADSGKVLGQVRVGRWRQRDRAHERHVFTVTRRQQRERSRSGSDDVLRSSIRADRWMQSLRSRAGASMP